jgi:hypothetical protein
MRQDWHHLSFLHWKVPADQIRPLVPTTLELDLFEGDAYLGLVPFTMTGVRPVWAPAIAPLSNFHETNVRTYVHFEGRDPGVWFFSLDAAARLAVLAARALFRLPYFYARMSLTVSEDEAGAVPASVAYASTRRWPRPTAATSTVRVTPLGTPAPAVPGTLDHFLAERYLLYTTKHGKLYRGQVHHTPYPLQPARVSLLEESLIGAAGLSRPPTTPIAHYAREVRVEIFPLESARSSGPS